MRAPEAVLVRLSRMRAASLAKKIMPAPTVVMNSTHPGNQAGTTALVILSEAKDLQSAGSAPIVWDRTRLTPWLSPLERSEMEGSAVRRHNQNLCPTSRVLKDRFRAKFHSGNGLQKPAKSPHPIRYT
jgi:hypothetical protein